jgi:hypothetical protein
MKKYLPLVVTLLLALAGATFAQDAKPSPEASPKPKPAMSKAQIQRNLIASEKKLWEAWKNKDPKPFKAWVAADSAGVGEMGVQGKAELLKDIAAGGCDIKSFELSNFKMNMISSGVAFLTYKGVPDGTCGGNPIPPVWASSTWVNRGGKWVAVTHQETPTK